MGLADDGTVSGDGHLVHAPPARPAAAAARAGTARDLPRRGERGRHLALCRAVHGPCRHNRHGQYRRRGHGTGRGRAGRSAVDDGRGAVRHGYAVCRGLSCGALPQAAGREMARRAILLHRAGAGLALARHDVRSRRSGGRPARRGHGGTGQQHHDGGRGAFSTR